MQEFYRVPETTWVFRDQLASQGDSYLPEEAVRQWCIQELIRTYGVRIDCIEIERLVKVARERKPNRADVVVLRNGQPYVVIECKSPRYENLSGAMDQAKNYAILPEMNAEFAVATNGKAWFVERLVGREWAPVADLPDFRRTGTTTNWCEILKAIGRVSPVLHWLDDKGRWEGSLGQSYFLLLSGQ